MKEIVNLGANIKARRNELKLTQEQLAENLEVSPQYISLIENGKTGFSINLLFDIARELDISPRTLFEPTEGTSNENENSRRIAYILSDCNKKENEVIIGTIVSLKRLLRSN